MDIRVAGVNDIPLIKKIAEHTWGYAYDEILTHEQTSYMLDMMYSIESLTNQMTSLGHHFFLIKEAMTTSWQGFVSYELNYKRQLKTKLHKLYVLPEAHGSGFGRYLINKVISEARKNGNEWVTLNMNRENKAKVFYENLGFKIVAEEDIDIGNGYLMEDYIFEIKV